MNEYMILWSSEDHSGYSYETVQGNNQQEALDNFMAAWDVQGRVLVIYMGDVAEYEIKMAAVPVKRS